MADFTADPLLRLLPSEPPASFLAMPEDEQRRRGRVFLALYGMGKDEAFCWGMALQNLHPGEARLLADQVALIPDERLRAEVLARIDDERVAANTPKAAAR